MRTTGPLVLTALLALPCGADAAYYFEANTRTEGDGKTEVVRVRGYVDGDKARIEAVEGAAMPFVESGSYLLTTGGGSSLYIVNPAEMTYSEMDLDQLLAMAGGVLNAASGVLNLSFTDFVNDKLAEEPGGSVLGYDTTRLEFLTGYTLNMGMLGMRRSTRTETRQELWCSDAIDADGLGVWASPDRLRTGNAELDALIKAQYQDLDCVPLRSRVTTTTSNGGRREAESVSETEFVTLREEASVPAGTFDLPAGYRVVSLMPDMSELPPFGAAPAAEEAPADEPEEGRRRRGLGGLRDLIRNR